LGQQVVLQQQNLCGGGQIGLILQLAHTQAKEGDVKAFMPFVELDAWQSYS
jgi:hypothetical protein